MVQQSDARPGSRTRRPSILGSSPLAPAPNLSNSNRPWFELQVFNSLLSTVQPLDPVHANTEKWAEGAVRPIKGIDEAVNTI